MKVKTNVMLPCAIKCNSIQRVPETDRVLMRTSYKHANAWQVEFVPVLRGDDFQALII